MQLADDDAQTRKWVCLLLGKLIHNFDEAQEEAFRTSVHEQVAQLLLDDVSQVRAAAVYALSCFIGKPELQSEKSENRVHGELTIAHHLFKAISDGSVLVRRELVHALSTLINSYSDHLCPSVLLPMIEDDERGVCRMPPRVNNNQEEQKPRDLKDRELGKRGYLVLDLCKIVLLLTHDASTEVARYAIQVNAYLKQTFLNASPLLPFVDPDLDLAHLCVSSASPRRSLQRTSGSNNSNNNKRDKSPVKSAMPKSQSIQSNLFKKSSSEPNFEVAMSSSSSNNSTPDHHQQHQMSNSASVNNFADVDQSSSSNFAKCPESLYYDWCVEDISKPMLPENQLEDSDHVSPRVQQKQRRSENLVKEALSMYKTAGKKPFNSQIGGFGDQDESVSRIKFHPTEPYLLAADDNDKISVWNWIAGHKVTSFRCGSRLKGKVSDFQIISEQCGLASSLLLVSSNSGNVCMYKDFDTAKPRVISSFRASGDMRALENSPGCITSWQPSNGFLYATGENTVKIWDVEREMCIQNVETDAFPTCITADNNVLTTGATPPVVGSGAPSFVFAIGCNDGQILTFDRRMSKVHKPVMKQKEHKSYVLNVHMQRINSTQIISGSTSGDIKFWDTRVDSSVKTFEAHKGSITALAIHDYAPILASGSNNQFVKVFNTAGENLNVIYYHEGFLGQRIGPVSCLAFHPYKLCLASGSTDTIIALYTGDVNFMNKMKKLQKKS